MEFPYYPINDFGPAMKGMVIGGLGIFHVFLAQFAIGGGMLMCYFQWLSQTGREPAAREALDGYFKFLVLVSFVAGALTGVGMWFTTIQISPRTIGMMVEEFHWIWATEWTFFCLEVAAGYAYYRCGEALPGRARMTLLALYSAAAWFSLFWINGILSWQLTPGGWMPAGSVWAGFFNPSFWPSLFYRTIAAMSIAALVACVVVNAHPRLGLRERDALIHRAAHFLAPMALMPFLGLWYLYAIPADSRAWALGGSAAMTLFTAVAAGASLFVGLYALVGLNLQRLTINGATATLLCGLAFVATGGGEFVREGVRKPYTVRGTLFSNSIAPAEVAELRRVGSVTRDPYPLRHPGAYPNDQVRLGAKVFRFQCGVCHTVDGANGLVHLAGTWTLEQLRLNIAKLQLTKPFVPPFSGTADELEALVQLISWNRARRPQEWPLSNEIPTIVQIDRWLQEAGIHPASQREGKR
ncbi:MAG: cytochrome c [Candidatus Tectomicrobia bacterium]|nr:cytochrome c [Candidatus Tectomicrobia bacterium]